jgi:hypothetical protein
MEAANTIYHHNIKGVTSMVQGDHRSSQSELENALKAFRSSLRNAGGNPHQNGYQHRQETPDTNRGQIEIQSISLPQCLPVATSPFCYNALTVFNRAFIAVEEISSSDDVLLPATNQHIIPAILLYNLGLSYHTEGMKRGTTHDMFRAYQFYRHSFSLLERAPIVDGKEKTLLAALCNNMAHVSSCFFFDDSTMSSMNLLRNVVESGTTGDLEEEDITFFTMNLVFYSEFSGLGLAPAA